MNLPENTHLQRKTFRVVVENVVVKGAPGMQADSLKQYLEIAFRPSPLDIWFTPKVISVEEET